MDRETSQIKNLSSGDLVTHVLYGKEWVGIILGFKIEEESYGNRREKALVQIQPGTKYEDFFQHKVSEKNRMNSNLGYITTNWLFKIEVKDGKSRSSRDEAPGC
ncbi:MAG: hypothetical protein CMA72_09055 [Euryarchaeota archaeon]|nr:hypothetical protein [Euryarchaeota archaeon]|tara:strand:- start:1267 stop:1578 length:312 start_codon:yes stop_codon:yes gene_type:complete